MDIHKTIQIRREELAKIQARLAHLRADAKIAGEKMDRSKEYESLKSQIISLRTTEEIIINEIMQYNRDFLFNDPLNRF